MTLTPQEESLINAVRTLSPGEVRKVLDWARGLSDLSKGRLIQWSDSWNEEDMADATRASVKRFDEEEDER